MSTSQEMSIDERLKYLRSMKPRYVKAGRKVKGRLLGDMAAVTGYNRRHLIELLSGDLGRHPRRGARGRMYGPEVDDALRVITSHWTTSVRNG